MALMGQPQILCAEVTSPGPNIQLPSANGYPEKCNGTNRAGQQDLAPRKHCCHSASSFMNRNSREKHNSLKMSFLLGKNERV